MLAKLAIKNVVKSLNDYIIYFTTLTLAVSIFYVFNSIDSQKAMLVLNESASTTISILDDTISYISVVVIVILGMLMLYANSFIINKRQKEFGLYLLFGMSRLKVSRIILYETCIVALIAVFSGLILGVLFSQATTYILSYVLEASTVNATFVFSMKALVLTTLNFIVLFIFLGMFNIFIISKYQVVDLLNGHRKNSSLVVFKKAKEYILLTMSLILIGSAYFIVLTIDAYTINLGSFFISGTLVIIGFLLFIRSVSIVFSKRQTKIKSLFFVEKKMIFSTITNFYKTTTIVSLVLAFFIVVALSSLNIINHNNLQIDSFYPYELTILVDSNVLTIDQANMIINPNGTAIVESNVEIKSRYIENNDELGITMYSSKIISDNQYNKLYPKNQIGKLKDNEFKLLTSDAHNFNSTYIDEAIILNADFTGLIKPKKNIANLTNYESFRIVSQDTYDSIPSREPDNDAFYEKYLYLNYSFRDSESRNKLYEELGDNELLLLADYGTQYFSDEAIYSTFDRQNSIEENYTIRLTAIFLLSFISIILFISTCTILSLQQLHATNNEKRNYKLMHHLGTSKRQIKGMLFRKHVMFFFLPLLLAIPNVVVGIIAVQKIFYMSEVQFNSTIAVISSLVLVSSYTIYMLITYHVSYKSIRDIFN